MGFLKDVAKGFAGGITGLAGSALGFLSQSSANKTNLAAVRETNAANQAINQANIDYQREAADTAWQRQQQMFDMQNAYNSPLAARNRLESAGYNPMFGLDESGASTSVPTAPQAEGVSPISNQAPSVDPYDFDSLAGSLGDIVARVKLMDAQSENIGKDSILKGMDAVTHLQENQARLQKIVNDTNLSDADRRRVETDIAINNLQQEFLAGSMQGRVQQVSLQNHLLEEQANNFAAQSALYKIDQMFRGRLNEAQIQQIHASIAKFQSDVRLQGAQAALAGSMQDLNDLDFRTRQQVQSAIIDSFGLQNDFTRANTNYISNRSGLANYEYNAKMSVPVWLNGWTEMLGNVFKGSVILPK